MSNFHIVGEHRRSSCLSHTLLKTVRLLAESVSEAFNVSTSFGNKEWIKGRKVHAAHKALTIKATGLCAAILAPRFRSPKGVCSSDSDSPLHDSYRL